MAREWKPGDVALATVKGRPNVRVVAGWSRYEPRLRWCELSPRWGDGEDDTCWYFPPDVRDARPLLVIDPESDDDLECLWRAVVATGCNATPGDLGRALRSLLAPPKPHCSAHGEEECEECSRIRTRDLTDDGGCRHCVAYAVDGMHWDTCPGRIGTVYPTRADALAAQDGAR